MPLAGAARLAAAEGRERVRADRQALRLRHIENKLDANVKIDDIENIDQNTDLKYDFEELKNISHENFINDNIKTTYNDVNLIRENDHSALKQSNISNHSDDQRLVCSPDVKKISHANISKLIKKYTLGDIGMLRAGEYSPNNPELAGDGRPLRGGDAFLGFGLYEEKRKKLLKKRQIEYREYLAKQSQVDSLKKQNIARIAPGRNLFLEDEKTHFVNQNMSNHYEYLNNNNVPRRPSSVGVQTDPDELDSMSYDRRLSNTTVTRAERELSPRPSLNGNTNTSDWRMLVEKVNIGTQNNLIVPPSIAGNKKYLENLELSPSIIGKKNFNETRDVKKNEFADLDNSIYRKDSPRARLLQDLRHTYMPSLFDADSIKQRNLKIEEEAAVKRMAYQIELKKQIEEQQKNKEDRKAKEKLLEEAETRRLEEQLKMLKMTHENEIVKQKMLSLKMQNEGREFEQRRLKLHNEIENEKKNLKNVKLKMNIEPKSSKLPYTNPSTHENQENRKSTDTNFTYEFSSPPYTSNNEPDADLLSYNVKRNNPYVGQDLSRHRLPYSSNIPDNSVFTQSIPVKNYNDPTNQPISFLKDRFSHESRTIPKPKESVDLVRRSTRPNYEPAFLSKKITDMIDLSNLKKEDSTFNDSLPIPVLREPEKHTKNDSAFKNNDQSDAMRKSEIKWQVPAVQKNILRNNYSEDGKQENILTQLGSIRRQLQLEQLKLDQSQFFSKQLIK